VEVLDPALDASSAAAHKGRAPKALEVNAVMDIVENLLHAVYVLPGIAKSLRACNKTPDSSRRHLQNAPDPKRNFSCGCDSKILDIDSHSGREENCPHSVAHRSPPSVACPSRAAAYPSRETSLRHA
jgi:hypothetical protein